MTRVFPEMIPLAVGDRFYLRNDEPEQVAVRCIYWEIIDAHPDQDGHVPVRRVYSDGGWDYDLASLASLAQLARIHPPPPAISLQAWQRADGVVEWRLADRFDYTDPFPDLTKDDDRLVGYIEFEVSRDAIQVPYIKRVVTTDSPG
jgi:hypothetical protein